ncbi:putative nol1 nop2 sun family protein [Phialemonium atrogriseum]|uniref:Nol1 nop2 sun family protein n=1 Tax=Phialemonium atrogriseum TaxID=1093897 RepID=A0AAJ0FNN3_9PEZI|nr:putative nol1 nop2 sun family protein [Phialemonium atrogriseum]KAK1769184.1 putative nol1 nop2 sun family protein [Phialemonium atrogriseum]
MSLYHEASAVLSQPASEGGGSLKSRIYGKKDLKSPPAQLYALALETCKWSGLLKEVIEASGILQLERKLTPVLSLLLVHDFLLSKGGIALPQSHGLRASIERHKARLNSEFTRARLRRKLASVEALRAQVEAESRTGPVHPRWIRINTLKTTLRDQLETTFAGFEAVSSVRDILAGAERAICLDPNVPDLVALSPGTDFTKTDAYRSGAIILQDKASCFPALLLDPASLDGGDVVDSCAAPGNKTTHLAALVSGSSSSSSSSGGDGAAGNPPRPRKIFAFEKDKARAATLERMVQLAGADHLVRVGGGQDFLKVDPKSDAYRGVRALLLDPSCSGSGIVGRDEMPELHLPDLAGAAAAAATDNRKRKRTDDSTAKPEAGVLVDDDGEPVAVSSGPELRARIDALAAFQLGLVLHALSFPAAERVVYSTCSVHARENEEVVLAALRSDVARRRGWRVRRRAEQVPGMRDWPVRGDVGACGGDEAVAGACIRTYKDDGRGVMGFFVVAFVRDV